MPPQAKQQELLRLSLPVARQAEHTSHLSPIEIAQRELPNPSLPVDRHAEHTLNLSLKTMNQPALPGVSLAVPGGTNYHPGPLFLTYDQLLTQLRLEQAEKEALQSELISERELADKEFTRLNSELFNTKRSLHNSESALKRACEASNDVQQRKVSYLKRAASQEEPETIDRRVRQKIAGSVTVSNQKMPSDSLEGIDPWKSNLQGLGKKLMVCNSFQAKTPPIIGTKKLIIEKPGAKAETTQEAAHHPPPVEDAAMRTHSQAVSNDPPIRTVEEMLAFTRHLEVESAIYDDHDPWAGFTRTESSKSSRIKPRSHISEVIFSDDEDEDDAAKHATTGPGTAIS